MRFQRQALRVLFMGGMALAPTSAFAADDAATRIAKVYQGQPVLAAMLQKQMHLKVSYCLQSGQIDKGQASAADRVIDAYQAEVNKMAPDMQVRFADEIRLKLSAEDMIQLADFLESSSGRNFVLQFSMALAGAIQNNIQFCPRPAPLADLATVSVKAMESLSPEDRAYFRTFAAKPAAKKFGVLGAAAQTVRVSFQDQLNAAGKKSGLLGNYRQ